MRGFYDSGWSFPFTGANIKRVINPLKTEVPMIGYMTQVDSKKTSWLQETNPQEGNFLRIVWNKIFIHTKKLDCIWKDILKRRLRLSHE